MNLRQHLFFCLFERESSRDVMNLCVSVFNAFSTSFSLPFVLCVLLLLYFHCIHHYALFSLFPLFLSSSFSVPQLTPRHTYRGSHRLAYLHLLLIPVLPSALLRPERPRLRVIAQTATALRSWEQSQQTFHVMLCQFYASRERPALGRLFH